MLCINFHPNEFLDFCHLVDPIFIWLFRFTKSCFHRRLFDRRCCVITRSPSVVYIRQLVRILLIFFLGLWFLARCCKLFSCFELGFFKRGPQIENIAFSFQEIVGGVIRVGGSKITNLVRGLVTKKNEKRRPPDTVCVKAIISR